MGRSRSRSPRRRERRRSRSKEKDRFDKFGRDERRFSRDEPRKRDYYQEETSRKRDRCAVPIKDREISTPSHPKRNENDDQRKRIKEMFVNQDDVVDDETRRMQQLMGINGFNTSKNKHKDGNASGCSKINKPRRFRQYMNRRGGFNRPLDWVQ